MKGMAERQAYVAKSHDADDEGPIRDPLPIYRRLASANAEPDARGENARQSCCSGLTALNLAASDCRLSALGSEVVESKPMSPSPRFFSGTLYHWNGRKLETKSNETEASSSLAGGATALWPGARNSGGGPALWRASLGAPQCGLRRVNGRGPLEAKMRT